MQLLRALGSFSLSRATLTLGTTVRVKGRRLGVEVLPADLSGAGGLGSHAPGDKALGWGWNPAEAGCPVMGAGGGGRGRGDRDIWAVGLEP